MNRSLIGNALIGIGALCLGLLAAWNLLPSPLELVYHMLSSSPKTKDATNVYLLQQIQTWLPWTGLYLLCVGAWMRRLSSPTSRQQGVRPRLPSAWNIFLISFLTLYYEVLLIRWLGSEIRFMVYFKNLTLICCFLGLGAGMMLQRKEDSLFPYFPLVLTLTVLLTASPLGRLMGRLSIPWSESLHFWHSSIGLPHGWLFFAIIVALIVLQVAIFIPLGQATALWMKELPPLRAYTVNILGALAGLWTFSWFSHLGLPSYSWFIFGSSVLLVLITFLYSRAWTVMVVVLCLGSSVAVYMADKGALWSPYYKIELSPVYLDAPCAEDLPLDSPRKSGKVPFGLALVYNGIYFVNAVNGDPAFLSRYPQYAPCAEHYLWYSQTAFQHVSPKGARVLVLASGAGNDVAAALRYGAARVDAVDIDPVPLDIGAAQHPERPYASPKVRVFVADARTWLQNARERYDYILFASLDSQALLSGMSNVRLDNYVYTRECIAAAKEVLSPTGVLAVVFWGGKPLNLKILSILRDNFHDDPILEDGLLSATGPGITRYLSKQPPSATVWKPGDRIPLDPTLIPHDDWPFVYAKKRAIPPVFFAMGGLLLAITLWFTHRARVGLGGMRFDFLFLGAGFLLLEAKAVTSFALMYGSTWFVNTIVFSVVLIVILLGNWTIERFPRVQPSLFYAGVLLSLVLNYWISSGVFLSWPFIPRTIFSSLLWGSPFYFAACIFARAFHGIQPKDVGKALGSNLIGSMAGGMVENSSLIFGFAVLNLLAAGFYSLAWIASKLARLVKVS